MTWHSVNHVPTQAMKEGVENEPFARMLYEAKNQIKVEIVGFALHPVYDWMGCSADGLVGTEGGWEGKCPTLCVHSDYLDDISLLVDEYQPQVLGCLMCYPLRQWWDLMTFNPHFRPRDMERTFRFHRSDWQETLDKIEAEAANFNAEIEAELAEREYDPTIFDVMPDEKYWEDARVAAAPAYDSARSFAENCEGINLGIDPLDSM